MIHISEITKIHHRGETEVRALRGITCDIEDGSFTFVIGPSGSGKSTLLCLLGALDEPTSGEITVDGRKLSEFSKSERDEYRRERVGFVFQNFNLLKNLDAVDNTLVPYMPKGVTRDQRTRAVELLHQVGLGDRLEHRPNHLSGGEQQRVAIARALLKQPAMILADEPTGELDSETGAEVFGYLRRMHREHGTTVVVVTHDQRYIAEGDRVLKMRDGLLVNGEG